MSQLLGIWVEVEIKEYDEDFKFWDVVAWGEKLVHEEGDIDTYVTEVENSISKSQKIGKVYTNYVTRCGCGEEVLCRKHTNECDGCGELYNRYGQHLRPRDEWEDDY